MRVLNPKNHSAAESVMLLLVRLVMGVAFIMHGWPKIQQPMRWMGEALPGAVQAVAAYVEVLGGILLILGLLTPLAALLLVLQMIAALSLVHVPAGHPFVGQSGQPSSELAAIYLVVAGLIMVFGPGMFSIDALAFRAKRRTAEDRKLPPRGTPHIHPT